MQTPRILSIADTRDLTHRKIFTRFLTFTFALVTPRAHSNSQKGYRVFLGLDTQLSLQIYVIKQRR